MNSRHSDTDLPDRILAWIAKSTSQRPARAADVLAMMGGEATTFWAAVEQLYREHRINTAHVQKRGEAAPWLAIWPTGVLVAPTRLSGNALTSLFVRHRPLRDALRAAQAPRSRGEVRP